MTDLNPVSLIIIAILDVVPHGIHDPCQSSMGGVVNIVRRHTVSTVHLCKLACRIVFVSGCAAIGLVGHGLNPASAIVCISCCVAVWIGHTAYLPGSVVIRIACGAYQGPGLGEQIACASVIAKY